MAEFTERRDNRRIALGPGHTIRFRVGGRIFKDIRITNISGSGLFATVDRGEAGLFEKGVLLEDLVLDHPLLPKGHIRAQVVYTLGQAPETPAMAFVGMGMHFLEMPKKTQEDLNNFVAAAMGEA
ncbi:MAG: PilZ domain-containing protein [Holophagaceae bacterium]|nr:PilZ domain-containing protein [Holophagaceae bacterium]